MIAQKVNIPDYDWQVDILYDARPKDADNILNIIWDMGCARIHLHRAERLLKSGVPNEGLTFSNHRRRESIIVVCHVDSPFELANTLMHEVDHLQQAICKADNLYPDGEDAAYLMGAITEAITRNAWYTMRKLFLYLI